MQAASYIKRLIRTNQNQQAIEVLEVLDSHNHNALVIQAAALNKLQEEYNKRILSFEEYSKRLAQVQSILLDILWDLPENTTVEVGAWDVTVLNVWYHLLVYKPYLITLILVVNAALAIYLYSVPSSTTFFDMEIQLSRVEFKQVSEDNLFTNLSLVDIQIQGVEKAFIPANEVVITTDNLLQDLHELDGQLTFQLAELNANLSFSKVRLSELQTVIGSKNILTLYPGEQNLEFLGLDIANSTNTNGRLEFQDSVAFESENYQVNIPAVRSGLLMGTAYLRNNVSDILFESSRGLVTLIMVVDSINISKSNLEVDSLRFTRYDDTGSSISSITGATINLITTEKEKVYQTITVNPGDFLRLVNQQNMSLLKLEIVDNSMSLRIKGKADQVLLGSTLDQMSSRNPSKLLFIWHNQRIWIIIYTSIILLIIGAGIFLLKSARS